MSKQAEAELILKLFELRREPKMREARDWYAIEFNPESAEDIQQALFSANGVHLRMVTSYWEMAAALVNHNAISMDMFDDTSGEYMLAFSKVEPYLDTMRQMFGPQFMSNLEKVVDSVPNGRERSVMFRERMKQVRARFAANQKAAGQS